MSVFGSPITTEFGCERRAGAGLGACRSQILGAVAQLGERGLCKPEVVGSIPISSTREGGGLVGERRLPARSNVSSNEFEPDVVFTTARVSSLRAARASARDVL